MPSIIVPAHNEASVIVRCCKAILGGAYSNELEFIVVCNGCTDSTADLVRSFSDKIKVIETDIPSKSNALNLGDEAATRHPRFYVDADVVIALDAIRKITSVLKQDDFLAAAPKMQVDLTDRPWPVKAFYQVWLQLPYFREGMIGSGVYALSKDGRKRFKKFPPITADDGFVRALFSSKERVTVQSCNFVIYPPKTLQGLISIKTRAYFGKLEMNHRFPELINNEITSHSNALVKLALKTRWWAPLITYCYVRFASRVKAMNRFRRGISHKWDRDESSR